MKSGGPLKRKTPMQSGNQLARTAKPAKRKMSASTVIPKDIRDAVMERDQRHCQRCGTPVDGKPYSRHHRSPRQMGGSTSRHTMANVVLLCGDALFPGYCHSEVESYRKRAVREGWLVPMGIAPEDWPVLRFGLEWSMPGVSWVECEPHPVQVEMGNAA